MPAFLAAIAAGADGVEFDVQLAADGEPVVIHDATLDRTAGRPGRVAACTAGELAVLGIPLLREVLNEIPPPAILNIEIKDFRLGDYGLERRVLALVQAGNAQGRVLFSSFNPWALARLRRADPRAYTAQLTAPSLPFPLRLAARQVHPGIHPHVSEVTPEALRGWRERDRRVIAWGDRNEAELRSALGMDLEGVITDRAGEAVRFLGG